MKIEEKWWNLLGAVIVVLIYNISVFAYGLFLFAIPFDNIFVKLAMTNLPFVWLFWWLLNNMKK